MKKIISLLLAMIMVFSLATVAAADETPAAPSDEATVTLTKNYVLENEGTKSPRETFEFTELTCISVVDGGVGVTVENAPVPTIDKVEYAAGDAGHAVNAEKKFTITMPTYTAVGKYTYTFSEIDGHTAGVTYRPEEITLVVTVIQGENGKLRVATVHTEAEGADAKSDIFENKYSAGDLSVKKTVTGNLGDQDKIFEVTVTFTAPEGDTVREVINYTDVEGAKSIDAGWTGTKSVVIKLKHDVTTTFANVPYGVTYTVKEANYTADTDADGYDAPKYDGVVKDQIEGSVAAATISHVITNNKEVEVDTGIALDSAPYFVILAVAMFGMVALVSKKRYEV